MEMVNISVAKMKWKKRENIGLLTCKMFTVSELSLVDEHSQKTMGFSASTDTWTTIKQAAKRIQGSTAAQSV